MPSTTSALRARTTRLLSGLELPDCFASATASAEALLLAKPARERSQANKRDLKRLGRQLDQLDTRGSL